MTTTRNATTNLGIDSRYPSLSTEQCLGSFISSVDKYATKKYFKQAQE